MTAHDPFIQLKAAQREGWGLFAPLEAITTIPAAALVKFAQIKAGQQVLDVGCGTGVAAITAARAGARVRALDLSPVLLERAVQNARLANVEVDFKEGDVEALPYGDASFDVVVSQFGHMFGPRPDVTTRELLRVLKPGGRLAFSTWPPELFTGSMFALVNSYLPAPSGVAPAPTPLWGDPTIVRERLGDSVTELHFGREVMVVPALSPAHYARMMEATAAPIIKIVEILTGEPARLAEFRAKFEALIVSFMDGNAVHQHFLMSRAIKK